MKEQFEYLGHNIAIYPQVIKKKVQFWFSVDSRPVTYCSDPNKARAIAIRYVDAINAEYHDISRQTWTATLIGI